MRWLYRLLVALCFLIPSGLIAYKVLFLKTPFIPPTSFDEWSLQIEAHSFSGDRDELKVPYPTPRPHQAVEDLRFEPFGLNLEGITSDAGNYYSWAKDGSPSQPLRIYTRVRPEEHRVPRAEVSSRVRTSPASQQYLKTPELSSEELDLIQELESAIFFDTDRPLERIRKIYLYISEEILFNSNLHGLRETLEISEGSNYSRSNLFNLMAQRAGVPSRMVLHVALIERYKTGHNQYRLSFSNEIWNGTEWFPIDVNRRRYGSLAFPQITLYHDFSQLNLTPQELRDQIKVYAEPIRTNKIQTEVYSSELKSKNSWLAKFSLFELPLSLQSLLYTIVLIPFGAVLLSFSRNMLGLPTFGIFTPVLLTLFFIETSLLFGLLFFFLVVTLGFFQRYVLDRFFLLAIPRLSILLTLVVISFVVFIALNTNYPIFSSAPTTFNYFPIVIVTIFIERFSVYFVEEGPLSTLKSLLGTLTISLLCFVLFTVDYLNVVVFTHPELMLWAMGLNALIGSYKGYRVSELIRFRDFAGSR